MSTVMPVGRGSQPPVRLYYLDWLRVIAIFGVFLYHSVHVFDQGDWQIKNVEQSLVITIILVLFSLWGMPFFFLIAGTGSWFALRRRTDRQYALERFKRLMIPFIVGAILFTPMTIYLEWSNHVQRGVWDAPLIEVFTNRNVGFSPRWFGTLGYHLWFLGFLFSYALLTLPLFRWLKSAAGTRLTEWLAKLCERRGGILAFYLPVAAVQLVVRPFFPIEHDWGDFLYLMAYFILGYVLYSDERFTRAIRRDWKLIVGVTAGTLLVTVALLILGDPFTWSESPGLPQFYLVWSLVALNGFGWTLSILALGMFKLDFSTGLLRYGQQAVLPFFMLHQPVIILIGYYVVQWNAGILLKLPLVVIGSFLVSIGIYELLIKRVAILRTSFGMTSSA
jgi:peptidoglycan/LPS O-acetylase OafA/YrhL